MEILYWGEGRGGGGSRLFLSRGNSIPGPFFGGSGWGVNYMLEEVYAAWQMSKDSAILYNILIVSKSWKSMCEHESF